MPETHGQSFGAVRWRTCNDLDNRTPSWPRTCGCNCSRIHYWGSGSLVIHRFRFPPQIHSPPLHSANPSVSSSRRLVLQRITQVSSRDAIDWTLISSVAALLFPRTWHAEVRFWLDNNRILVSTWLFTSRSWDISIPVEHINYIAG